MSKHNALTYLKIWYAETNKPFLNTSNTMEEQMEIRKEAGKIISDALGSETGLLYDIYFKTRSLEEIIMVLDDVLNEHLGEKKTVEIINQLKQKYQNKNING